MKRISINGKFLGSRLNGVHRTAAQFSESLRQAAPGEVDIRLVSPHQKIDHTVSGVTHETLTGYFGDGQIWEQVSLPSHTKNDLLLNFCNLGPLNHPNSVAMIHDMQTSLYPQDYSRKQSIGYKYLLPLVGKTSKRILTVSNFAKQCLIDFEIADPDKIFVVYNGADHILDEAPDLTIIERLGLAGKPFALTMGSSKYYKNIRTLLEVFAKPALRDLPLVVAGGPSAEEYRHEVETIPDNVIFTGFVSDAELRAFYENTMVFLFPSLTEGFGLPPVEAMQCGSPVITSNRGAMPEVCQDAVDYVDPLSLEDWTAQIEKYFSHAYRADQAEKAKRQARHYTWDNAGKSLWETLKDMI